MYLSVAYIYRTTADREVARMHAAISTVLLLLVTRVYHLVQYIWPVATGVESKPSAQPGRSGPMKMSGSGLPPDSGGPTRMSIRVLLLFMLLYDSVVLGAGILNLPLVGPLLGYVPMMVIMILVGLGLAAIGVRAAAAISRAQEEEAASAADAMRPWYKNMVGVDADNPQWLESMTKIVWEALVAGGQAMQNIALMRAGLGRAGRAAHLLGLAIFVYGADVGYLLIGMTSLQALASAIEGSLVAGGGFAIIGTVLMLSAVYMIPRIMAASARRGAIRQLALKFGGWCWSLPIIAATDNNLVALLLFTAVVLSSGVLKDAGGGLQDRRKAGMTADHRAAVTMMGIMVSLLFITGTLVLITAVANGMIVDFYAIAPDAFQPEKLGDWLRVTSLMIFAFLGTSIYLLCEYPPLFRGKRPPISRVIIGGSFIVMLVYGCWTLLCAFVLSPEALRNADSGNMSTHLLLGQLFIGVNPLVAWIATVTGFTFALLAITNACAGLTQALNRQIQIEVRQTRLPTWVSEKDYSPGILLAAMLAAIGKLILATDMDITAILGYAGAAGGGLLLLLPLFYPVTGQNRLRKWEVGIALIVATFLVTSIITLPASGAATWIKLVIATGFASMVVWLLVTVMRHRK